MYQGNNSLSQGLEAMRATLETYQCEISSYVATLYSALEKDWFSEKEILVRWESTCEWPSIEVERQKRIEGFPVDV
jgi:hypothetical protein